MTAPAGTVTVTVNHRSQNAYGDRTTTGTTTLVGCAFAPGASAENLQSRDEVSEVGILYAPAGAAILPTDQVVLPDGTTWEVNGTASTWVNPFTAWAPGVVIPLQRVTG